MTAIAVGAQLGVDLNGMGGLASDGGQMIFHSSDRSEGGFCSYHNRFPNLGALLQKYAEKDLSQCSLEEFIAIYYPTQSVHCFEAEGRDFGILLKSAAKTMGA